MGGLIAKAGLAEESTAMLYGLLLEATEKLQSENALAVREHWRMLGDLAFTKMEE